MATLYQMTEEGRKKVCEFSTVEEAREVAEDLALTYPGTGWEVESMVHIGGQTVSPIYQTHRTLRTALG